MEMLSSWPCWKRWQRRKGKQLRTVSFQKALSLRVLLLHFQILDHTFAISRRLRPSFWWCSSQFSSPGFEPSFKGFDVVLALTFLKVSVTATDIMCILSSVHNSWVESFVLTNPAGRRLCVRQLWSLFWIEKLFWCLGVKTCFDHALHFFHKRSQRTINKRIKEQKAENDANVSRNSQRNHK